MTVTQKFKGDDLELKMEAAGAPAFDLTSHALDDMYAGCFEDGSFLLMLYDAGRFPFSERVPRDAFPAFIREAVTRFPFMGSYESYIFIIAAVFGTGSSVFFQSASAGTIKMLINAADSLLFGGVFSEVIDGAVVESDFVDFQGTQISYTAVSGAESQYALTQLLSELIPAGLFPDLTIEVFSLFYFAADNGTTLDQVVDTDGDQIVFIET